MKFTNQQLTLSDLATPQQDLDKPEEERINTILHSYCCKEEEETIKPNLIQAPNQDSGLTLTGFKLLMSRSLTGLNH